MDNVERTGANFLEHTIAPSNVAKLQPIWSLSGNGSDFSAPIVVNGTLYYGSWNGNETAVNTTSGTVEWSTYLGTDTACGGYTPMGISSTPAYLDGTLYLGGGNHYWYTLNATTGSTEWRFLAGPVDENYYNWASALVYGKSLYIGLSSCFDNPLVPAGLLELNISGPTPTLGHQFNASPPGVDGESIWTTPALDPETNTLWLATGNENASTDPYYPIYANAIIGLNATTLNVTGSWQVPNVAGQDADFGSTPVLFQTASGVSMVVASDKNGVAYAMNQSNVSASGSWGPAWTLSTGGGFSGAAFDGHTLYLAGGSSVNAVVPANGTVLWSAGMDGGGEVLGSLAWANGLVYAAGGGEVEAIDGANGTVLWNATLPGGGSGVTEPVIANGQLYVASGDYGTQGDLTAYALPSPPVYSVTFTSTGAPVGSSWSVTLTNSSGYDKTISTGGATIAFAVANGTYAFTVFPPAGYSANPSRGNLTVGGVAVPKSVALSQNPSAWSGLPWWGFVAIGLVGILIVVVTMVGWKARHRLPPPPAPGPGIVSREGKVP